MEKVGLCFELGVKNVGVMDAESGDDVKDDLTNESGSEL